MDNTPATPEKAADKALAKASTKAQTVEFKAGAQGLDKPVFNTFRLGKKWAERVQIGDVVDLKVEDDDKARKAEVTGIITGHWDEVASLAVDNHAIQGFAAIEAGNVLKGLVEGIYGDDVKSNSVWTVLYLKPVE